MMIIKISPIRISAIAGLLAATALAGCSKPRADDTPVMENAITDEGVPADEATPMPVPEPTAEPTADTNTAAISPPPAAEIAPDVQVQDDADATGMTARVSRDEPPANNTEPQ